MTRWDCRRCSWTPEDDNPRGQLVEHATEARHPLCVLCGLSLPLEDPRACLPCIADVRRRLAAIEATYALLPETLGQLHSTALDRALGDSDDEAIPGGDALAMLAAGSEGLLWRGRPVTDDDMNQLVEVHRCALCGAETTDPSRHLLDAHDDASWSRIPELFAVTGVVDRIRTDPDVQPSDPPAVAFELRQWALDWAEMRDEALDCRPTVGQLADFLARRIGWAAANHDAFDEFASDLRRILAQLEVATATDDHRETGAPCIYCHAHLERTYGENGRADDWTCPRCHRAFSEGQYWLAVRQMLFSQQVAADTRNVG